MSTLKGMRWVFTEHDVEKNLFDWEKHDFIKFCQWQLEEAPDTGKEHYQGLLLLNKEKELRYLKKNLSASAHWEKMRANTKANIQYCSKQETRLDGPWQFGKESNPGKRNDFEELRDAVDKGLSYQALCDLNANFLDDRYLKAYKRRESQKIEKEREIATASIVTTPLRDWQLETVPLLLHQSDRQILWIVDELGGCGKTYLGQYLQVHLGYQRLSGGKSADLAYMLEVSASGYVFDFSRDQGDLKTPYTLLEQVKNQYVCCPKYESRYLQLKSNKIICFSNFWPIPDKFSSDRWEVYQLKKKGTIIEMKKVTASYNHPVTE